MCLGGGRSRHCNPGEVTLHVRNERWNSDGTKAFNQSLQSHGLAGPSCPGDQAMAVGSRQLELLRVRTRGSAADEDCGVAQARLSSARHFADAEGKRKRG